MKNNFHIIIISFLLSIIIWTSISLSGEYYLNSIVPLKLTDLPQGFSLGVDIPEKVTVRLKGRGWSLINFVMSDDIYLRASLRSDSGKINLNLLSQINENSWAGSDIHVLNVIPSIVTVKVDKSIEKRVPVLPGFDLNFKTGYGLATPISIEPDTITLVGSFSLLKKIESVKTEMLNFSNLDQSMDFETQIENIKNVRRSSSKVFVSLDVQKIVDREFTEILVHPENVPADRTVVFLPSTINITLRGGIEWISSLTADDLRSSVEYNEVLQDTLGSVSPKLSLPQNVELIKVKPERIRYIIKKF